MSNSAKDLNAASQDMIRRLDQWRIHGEMTHQCGQMFTYQVSNAVLNYTLGYDHMRFQPENSEKLNALASGPGGFAALDIPRDQVLMTALLPAVSFLRAQVHVRDGTIARGGGGLLLNDILREAAQLARLLCPEGEMSDFVKAYHDLTDTDIDRLRDQGHLSQMEIQGRA